MPDELFTSTVAKAAALDPPTSDDLDATVRPWLPTGPLGPQPLGRHHAVDISVAVEAFADAKGVMADPTTGEP